MANPPYSGVVIVIRENQDGLNGKVYAFTDVPEGSPIPRNIAGHEHSLFNSLDTTKTPKDIFQERQFATRTTCKTGIGQMLDIVFPDTQA